MAVCIKMCNRKRRYDIHCIIARSAECADGRSWFLPRVSDLGHGLGHTQTFKKEEFYIFTDILSTGKARVPMLVSLLWISIYIYKYNIVEYVQTAGNELTAKRCLNVTTRTRRTYIRHTAQMWRAPTDLPGQVSKRGLPLVPCCPENRF